MLAPMSMAQSFFRRALLAAAMIATVGSQTAFAADGPAADNGWFDPQAASSSPSSPSTAPAVPPPPAANGAPGDGSELPSLAPSPLLQGRGSASGSASASSAPDPADRDPRALTEFRPTLDPYGTWVQHPTYGTVWVPRADVVGPSFAPYVSSGHWALDEDSNWVWVSDYPFGGVVFHYGRWVWIGGTGWGWVPGYRYAPAWVSWRVPTGSYAYVGWAPMGPDYIWYNGYATSFWYGVSTPWVFCPSAYAFHPHVHYYVVRDRVLVTHLAANSRRYVPARANGVAAPQRQMFSSGPSLAAARVPASAAPSHRLRATSSASLPSSAPPGRYVAPAHTRAELESPRFTPRGARPALEPSRPRGEPRSFSPEPRSRAMEPSFPRPRSIEPSSPRPRSFEPSSPRPRSIEPSSPRSFSPSPRSGGGGGFRPSLPRGHR
jgi:hypothetical protein